MERDDLTMLVARNIEAIIARKGLTPAEVNRRAKLNQTGVNDILSGKSRNPRLDTIHKIAVLALGVPVSALFAEPSESALDDEISHVLGILPPDDRRRFLRIANALLTGDEDTLPPAPSGQGQAATTSGNG